MEKGIEKKEIALSIVDLLVIVFLMSGMIYFIASARSTAVSHPISTGWIVNAEGEFGENTDKNVDLEAYHLPRDIGRVSEITLTRLMPKKTLNESTLRIYSMISDIHVVLNGRTIYDSKRAGNVGIEISRGYTFIELPHSERSEIIRIKVTASDDAGLASVPDIVLTDSGRAYPVFIHERWLSILISFFMFMFGLVVALLSVIFIRLNNDYERLLHIGLFSTFAGVWLMSNQDALLIFGVSPERSSAAGYVAISLAFLPLLSLSLLARSNLSKRDEILIGNMIVINMVVAALLACLHFSGLLSYVVSVPVIHTVDIIDCLVMILAGVGKVSDMKLDERIYHYGLLYISAAGVCYVILYDLRVYARIIPMRYSELWFPIVIFSFLIILFISYMVHLYGMLLNKAEEAVLTRLAYNDSLTGLYNRVRAEEEFAELDESGEAYALVDLDLNGLKTVNDKYGHAQGDELISAFGRILREVFSHAGSCIRMGGDEFLVIVRGEYVDSVDELVEKLVAREKEESQGLSYEIDASYGVIKSSEMKKPVAEHLFSTADSRLYEMKQQSKKGRED
ncbi:MAG: diguanylate cyclase [Lachnospiraceae bacterium]|nr:diguanylate cyclase [Lachnospiraceae bacterium]